MSGRDRYETIWGCYTMQTEVRIHPTADVSPTAQIGAGSAIWHQAQVREGTRIGRGCILSKGVYVDAGVVLGDNVKVQNYVSIYHGVTIEDGVFCGPHCVFTNDKQPRAVNADGSLKAGDDWTLSETLVRTGASIGANSVIVCGVTIGAWAMIGAGSVVTRNVPDHGLVWGNPARLRGFVCACGQRLHRSEESSPPSRGYKPAPREASGARTLQATEEAEKETVTLVCSTCNKRTEVGKAYWESVQ
jgi:acetyltransferase-like isoleucine patch superfamily enzyme